MPAVPICPACGAFSRSPLLALIASAAALTGPVSDTAQANGAGLRCRRQRLPGIRVRGPSGDARLPRHPRHDHPHRAAERRLGSRRRLDRRRRPGSGRERPDAVAPGRRRVDPGHADDGLCRDHARRPGSRLRPARPERPGRREPQGRRPRDVGQAELVAGVARREAGHGSRPARELDEPLAPDRDRRVVERRPRGLQLRSPSASTVSASPRRPGARGARSPPASSSRIAASASSA